MNQRANIIEWLNSSFDGGDAIVTLIIVFVIWYLIWKRFLSKWLYKHNVGSFAYTLYEVGPIGIFGIAIIFVILITLLIGSIQAVVSIGINLLPALLFFWALIIGFFIFFVKKMRK